MNIKCINLGYLLVLFSIINSSKFSISFKPFILFGDSFKIVLTQIYFVLIKFKNQVLRTKSLDINIADLIEKQRVFESLLFRRFFQCPGKLIYNLKF